MKIESLVLVSNRSEQKDGYYVVANAVNVDGVPSTIKILPKGQVKSRKGPFLVDEAGFKEMYQYFKDRQIDVVVDYEHQTLDGVQAPAAAWLKNIELKEDGVYADVEWTDKAKEYIKNKEYRYLSPVILKRESDGRAVILHSVGLTNTPAIDGMTPIVNRLPMNGGETMDWLKKLIELLGLSEGATEEEVLKALQEKFQSSNTEVVANKEILGLLNLDPNAKLEDVKGSIIALSNPAGYVSMSQFKELQQKIQKKETDDLVQMAMTTGKITPAQREWAMEYALKDPSGFSNFVEKAPQIVPTGELITGGATKQVVNNDLQLSVNKMLDVSEEDFKKYGGAV